MHRIMKNLK